MSAVFRRRRASPPRPSATARRSRPTRSPITGAPTGRTLHGIITIPGRIGHLELTIVVDLDDSTTELDAWTIDAAGDRAQVTRDAGLAWIFDRFSDATFELVTELTSRAERSATATQPLTA